MPLANNYDNVFRDTVIYAYTHSPFYKWFYSSHNIDVFKISGLQDYSRMPILKKEDILTFIESQNIHNIRKICCTRNNILTFATTGTTTKRLLVPYTKTEVELCAQCVINALEWWGYKRGQPINFLAFGHSKDLGTAILSHVAKATGGKIYPYIKIKGQMDSIHITKGESVTLINSLSALLDMLNLSSYMKLFTKMNLKYILTLVTPPEFKSKLHIEISRRLGNINLIPVYGSVEMGFVGFACPYTFQSAYVHITQKGLFHIMSQSNAFGENGKGKLVYTGLDRKSFPFIKYDIGDIVSLKKTNRLCNCGFPNEIIKFESRQSLTLKIPDAAGYFIDILKIDEIVKEILPGSQIICVYGEHKSNYYLFLAIFIGIGGKIIDGQEQEKIKNKIMERIIQSHLPPYRIKERGISNLISQFHKNFPIFFINAIDIPKEQGANKPKMVLNLMQNEDLMKLEVYHDLFSKLDDYLQMEKGKRDSNYFNKMPTAADNSG